MNKILYIGSAEINPNMTAFPFICKMAAFRSINALEESLEFGNAT